MKHLTVYRNPLWISVCLFGFLWGTYTHLLPTSDTFAGQSLYGDKGDGLFNIWVMEHVYQSVYRGEGTLSDGRIFGPAHRETFWWSDNLLVPGTVFSLFRILGMDPVGSSFWTGTLFAILVYPSLIVLLLRIGTTTRMESLHWTWSVPVIAYLLTFSETRLQSYNHFQNVSALFVILLLYGFIRYEETRRARDLAGVGICQCLLLFSSPYQALIGVVLAIAWLVVLSTDPAFRPFTLFRQALPAALVLALPVIWITWQYASQEPVTYSVTDVNKLSMQFANFWVPLSDRGSHSLAKGGYLGAGLLGALGLLVVHSSIQNRSWLLQMVTTKRFWMVACLFGISFLDVKELKPLTVWLRFLPPLLVLGWIWNTLRTRHADRSIRIVFFIFLSAGLVYAITFGPSLYFENQVLDPGVYGWFRLIIPGFDSMRDLMRFTPTGQVLLVIAIWLYGFLPHFKHDRGLLKWVCWGLMGIQLLDMRHATPPRTDMGKRQVFSSQDQAVLSDLDGPLLILPMSPYHRSALYMFLFQQVPELELVNGYSGRVPDDYKKLLKAEVSAGLGSPAQMEVAKALGADYLFVQRKHAKQNHIQHLIQTLQVHYETPDFFILSLTGSAESPPSRHQTSPL